MMPNRIVSIVVPVFNAQKYIKECIESIINQTYKDIQVIIVDDGSTDNSLKICEELKKKDNRIHIIEQHNSGTASARKNGISHATGDYITFVDSDDYIDSDYIQTLVSYVQERQLVTSGLLYSKSVILDGIKEGEYIVNEHSPIIKNMISLDDNTTRGILSNMCGKLFDTHIAKEVICDIDTDIYYGEDGEFVYKYILRCDMIYVTDYCGYNYRVNSQSVVHSNHEDFLINVNKLYISLKESFNKSIYADKLIPQLERWIAMHIRIAGDIIGFENRNLFIKYIIPCKRLIAGKNIVVYGAGKVGTDYVRQIKKEDLCEKLIWVDKDYISKNECINIKIESPEILKKEKFDFVLIAIYNEKIATEIKKNLLNNKIQVDKIIYQKPINIEKFYA